MRVLHAIHSLSGGGAERQSQILAKELLGSAIEPHFVCVDDAGAYISEQYIHKLPRANKYDLSTFKSVAEIIDCVKPEVIHAWLPAAITIPVLFTAWRKGIPVIFSYRNRMFFHRPISIIEYIAALFFADKVVSNNVIAQSSLLYRWLYRIKRGETIYNAVEISEEKNSHRISPERTVRFVFFGRLTRQKNIPLMIDAISLLSVHSRLQVDIYGVGEDEPMLKQKIKALDLSDTIHLRGFCNMPRAEMLTADALIFPSLYEGMPNVLVEALASGLPVIASDIFASRDIIGNEDCVNWFNPSDAAALAACIESYMSGSELMYIRVGKGIELAKRFNAPLLANNYQAVYRELI